MLVHAPVQSKLREEGYMQADWRPQIHNLNGLVMCDLSGSGCQDCKKYLYFEKLRSANIWILDHRRQ